MAAKTKVKQPYLKYDSIVVASGAKDLDTGWFNDWPSFARASTLRWFTNRNSNIPQWASSQTSDRSDWAMEVHQAGIEFWAPTVNRAVNANVTDNFMPEIWSVNMPQQMAFEWQVAGTDFVLLVPGVHAPGAVGPGGIVYDSSPAGVVFPPPNGVPVITNSWKFPDPLKIAMRSTMEVQSRIEEPLNGMLVNMTGPGGKIYPTGPAGGVYTLANYYVIRVWLRGARYIDDISARG